jgi:two-component system response regulator AdeR
MALQPRVLMVEDHPDIAELYELKLQLEGYRVAIAADGVRGLQMAQSLKPDVILLDVHLPHLDGLQVLAALRDDDAVCGTPVVMISEDDSKPLVDEAHRLNAAAYLVKAHVLPSGLSRMVGSVLQGRAASTGVPGEAGAARAS